MSRLLVQVRHSTLPVLIVLCLAALTVSYAFADEAQRPLATTVIGDPDAAVTGKFAVGTATPGNKALTVVGVIDFLGSGTVHNYFTQGPGNNMQINTNVDEGNIIGDPSKSQWKLVLGSSLDWFSIRRSPASGTYNEDALFFIEGSTGRVGIATVDTNNNAAIPFTPQAKLHVETASGDALWTIWGRANATTGQTIGVYGLSASTSGNGVFGYATASTGVTSGIYGQTISSSGRGVFGLATASTGYAYGVRGESASTDGSGVFGVATATTGYGIGVYGQSAATLGSGVFGWATDTADSGAWGVYGRSDSTSGRGVFGRATASSGENYGVYGMTSSPTGYGVMGVALATTGDNFGVWGTNHSTIGAGVIGWAEATTGSAIGLKGISSSPSGYGVLSQGNMQVAGNFSATGTKAAIVETKGYGWRSLYAMESPQNWFEDFGQATLVAGEAVVSIEPIFAQTVNLADGYLVFLTPVGNCSLYVADKSSLSFTVRAQEGSDCGIAFDYRIIAPRLNYEDLRLKEAEDPQAMAAAVTGAHSAPAAP
jgi:hypothetical protein